MTPLEELRAFNELLKDLIEHKDVSAKISDIQYFKDVLKELQRQDGIEVQLVIPTKNGDVNFNDLFGDTEIEEKKPDEEIKKEIKEKVQEIIATKEKEKADDEYTISLSFNELKALYKIFFGNFSSVLKSPKLRKAIMSTAFKVHKAYTDAT